ncbi:4'-phosphopantetheinyl transferase family protein [Piscinibacter sp.]|uniref:4'-phosphopantetheinyl transferase family protein n=1 Tax=Piscinibacter sp. TaxID=1903157 RepID=UPI0039E2B044
MMQPLPPSIRELAAGGMGDLRLWLVDLREPDNVAATASTLARDEIERMARLRFEADRARYRRSHVALRRVLARELGVEPAALRYTPDADGKPRLTWPAEPVDFNLSHCRDFALIGLSRMLDVGVDIENAPSWNADELMQTARGVLSASELLDLQALPTPARLGALMHAWTRKEACLKALGVGLSIEPSLVHVGLDAGTRRVPLPVAEGREASADLVSLCDAAGDGFIAAAACIDRGVIHS